MAYYPTKATSYKRAARTGYSGGTGTSQGATAVLEKSSYYNVEIERKRLLEEAAAADKKLTEEQKAELPPQKVGIAITPGAAQNINNQFKDAGVDNAEQFLKAYRAGEIQRTQEGNYNITKTTTTTENINTPVTPFKTPDAIINKDEKTYTLNKLPFTNLYAPDATALLGEQSTKANYQQQQSPEGAAAALYGLKSFVFGVGEGITSVGLHPIRFAKNTADFYYNALTKPRETGEALAAAALTEPGRTSGQLAGQFIFFKTMSPIKSVTKEYAEMPVTSMVEETIPARTITTAEGFRITTPAEKVFKMVTGTKKILKSVTFETRIPGLKYASAEVNPNSATSPGFDSIRWNIEGTSRPPGVEQNPSFQYYFKVTNPKNPALDNPMLKSTMAQRAELQKYITELANKEINRPNTPRTRLIVGRTPFKTTVQYTNPTYTDALKANPTYADMLKLEVVIPSQPTETTTTRQIVKENGLTTIKFIEEKTPVSPYREIGSSPKESMPGQYQGVKWDNILRRFVKIEGVVTDFYPSSGGGGGGQSLLNELVGNGKQNYPLVEFETVQTGTTIQPLKNYGLTSTTVTTKPIFSVTTKPIFSLTTKPTNALELSKASFKQGTKITTTTTATKQINATVQREALIQKQTLFAGVKVKQIQLTRQTQAQIQTQTQAQQQIQIQKQTQAQTQAQKQIQTQRQIQTQITTTKTPVFKSFIPPKTSKQGQENNLFNVFVRKKGIFQKVNSKPLSQGRAIDYGANVVKNTAAATFKLISSKPTAGANNRGLFASASLNNDFYTKGNLFIQKANKRISSAGEKRAIPGASAQAKRIKKLYGA